MPHEKKPGKRAMPKNPIAAERVAVNRAKADERRQAAHDRKPETPDDEESESDVELE